MHESLFSIRMHSSLGGRHHSGAERLVHEPLVEETGLAFLRRAMLHERGCAESLSLRIEPVATSRLIRGALPDIRTCPVEDFGQGRMAARELLEREGVGPEAAERALAALSAGAAPGGGNMRGAVLVDAASGERLEPDGARGIRVSRMDLDPGYEEALRERLAVFGAAAPRIREALILAAKVASAPQVLAELCWSDDPSYVTGYVCGKGCGYARISHLKPQGSPLGGRAFFVVPGTDIPALIDYLQLQPFWATGVPRLHPPRPRRR